VLARSYYGRSNRPMALLEEAISLDPSLSEHHSQLGNLALQKDQTAQAMSYFKRATELDFKTSRIHFALERFCPKLGQMDKVAQEQTFEKLLA
jgi:tetratricopeptide (TPR) repeat protein